MLLAATDGRLFIATVTSHGITVVSPDREVLSHIFLDEDALPTNCCFEGSDLWVKDFGVGFSPGVRGVACGGCQPMRSGNHNLWVPFAFLSYVARADE